MLANALLRCAASHAADAWAPASAGLLHAHAQTARRGTLCGHAKRVRAQVLYLETTAAGGVTWEEVDSARLSGGGGGGGARAPRRRLSIKIARWCGRWAVGMDDFADGVVGAKSKNLAGARARTRPHGRRARLRQPRGAT